ncbi:hypothetical protein LCGC14_2012270 [marine sediment metagenome]|uniref:Uncharacterized protein n=1 Tax=marine sediment metagenome TaxID=412755 RepID=A0A0F9F051_9ZZZZ
MKLRAQPDPRIGTDQLAIVLLSTVVDKSPTRVYVHRRAGCPRVSPIQVYDGYLRCSKCCNPLTPEAASYVGLSADGYDERTNSFRI